MKDLIVGAIEVYAEKRAGAELAGAWQTPQGTDAWDAWGMAAPLAFPPLSDVDA